MCVIKDIQSDMISREAREAMNELDEAAEESLDDKRSYAPRRDFYETALDEVSKHGTGNELELMKDNLLRHIKSDNPPKKVKTFRQARRILIDNGYTPPEHSPLHRAGRAF